MLLVEKYEKGSLYLSLHRGHQVFIVSLYAENNFAEIPEWDRSIKVLRREFVKDEDAKAYFDTVKNIL
jgi:hypothetical protein